MPTDDIQSKDLQEERRSGMNNLVANLAILNERLANLITTFEKQTTTYDKKFESHESRILSIERFQMKIVGGLAILSILLQLGFNIINTWSTTHTDRTSINTSSSFSQPGVMIKQ